MNNKTKANSKISYFKIIFVINVRNSQLMFVTTVVYVNKVMPRMTFAIAVIKIVKKFMNINHKTFQK
jgi:hypothetical protein